MLRIVVTNEDKTAANLIGVATSVLAAIYAKMQEITLLLEARVKQKLSGEVLHVGKNRPGHTGGQLRASISRKVEQTTEVVLGTIFSSGDVAYAAIQEYGGTTSPHLIIPKRASVLAFVPDKGAATQLGKSAQNGVVFARRVNHPGSKMPERSYMRSALTEMSEQISLGIKQAVALGIQEKSK